MLVLSVTSTVGQVPSSSAAERPSSIKTENRTLGAKERLAPGSSSYMYRVDNEHFVESHGDKYFSNEHCYLSGLLKELSGVLKNPS